MKKTYISILSILFLLALSACGREREIVSYDLTTSLYYDTTVSIRLFHEEDEDIEDIKDELHEIMRKTHRLSSWFQSYEGIINVKTINENPGVFHEVDPVLFDMIALSIEYYEQTDGYFDITLGPVIEIWDEYRDRCNRWRSSIASEENRDELYEQEKDDYCKAPNIEKLQAANAYVGIDRIELDYDNYAIKIEAGTKLDLGGVAKGYGARMLGEYLKTEDRIEAFLVNAGSSNVEVYGDHPFRDNNKFIIALTNPALPFGPNNSYGQIYLQSGENAVTSGDYNRYYEVDGRIYHHLIDPNTLFPTDHHRAVTLISDDGALGDILKTAVFVMSLEKGLEFINNRDDLEAIWFIDECQEPVMSDGFEANHLRHFTIDFECNDD